MKVAHLLIIWCVIAPVLDAQNNRSPRETGHLPRPDQIHPTMILWNTGLVETITEQIPLSAPVQPEGPGLDVFVARLPLAVGYKTHYAIVDRWGGHGSTRVKAMTLYVSNQSQKNTALGRLEVYDVLIRPDDGSFQISEQVFTRGPHFPVRVEYTREGKTYPASEVIAFVSAM